MKTNRAIIALAGLLGFTPSLSIQKSKSEFLIEKLTASRIMDKTSAIELVQSLNEKDLGAMVEALSNPQLQAATESVAIVHGK